MKLDTIVRISEAWPSEKQLAWLRQRLNLAGIVYRSHGNTGDCPCRTCLILRLRIAALEDV